MKGAAFTAVERQIIDAIAAAVLREMRGTAGQQPDRDARDDGRKKAGCPHDTKRQPARRPLDLHDERSTASVAPREAL